MKLPSMEHFKARNAARVRIRQPNGKYKAIYLGNWGSKEAQEKYDELIAELVTTDRNADRTTTTVPTPIVHPFLEHCESYYVKNGEQTSEVSVIRIALREVVAQCGRLPASQFSPLRLKAIRERMIAQKWKRNRSISRSAELSGC
ncbi:MAG: hypothetical protein R3C59_17730 [Planctomycetaceae bacterium]